MPLTNAFDLILGDEWLVCHNAFLHMAEGICVLRYKHKALRLQSVTANVKSHPLRDLESDSSRCDAEPPHMLSHLQVKRLVRKKQRAFLALVKPDKVHGDSTLQGEEEQDFDARIRDGGADRAKIKQILEKYKNVFPKEFAYQHLPPEREVSHTIPLKPGAKPVARPIFRYSPRELEEMETHIKDMLRLGLIEPSNSPWGAPVLFAPKKNGKLRMCVDWRLLNSQTIRMAYPIPRTDDLLDKLNGSTIYSSCDGYSAYHQVRIASTEDMDKASMRTPFGTYRYKVLAFGLTSAPAVFVQIMDKMFRDKGLAKICGHTSR
jgi:hypothetical protein